MATLSTVDQCFNLVLRDEGEMAAYTTSGLFLGEGGALSVGVELPDSVRGDKQRALVAAEMNLVMGMEQLDSENQVAGSAYTLTLAVEGFEKAFGVDHERVSEALYQKALALNELRRQDEAFVLLQRSLEIKQKAFGASHVDVASVLAAMGRSRRFQNRKDEALALYKQSIAMFEAEGQLQTKAGGDALHWMGVTFTERDELPEATEALQRSVNVKTSDAVYGSKPMLAVADTFSLLANILSRRGLARESLAYHKRSAKMVTEFAKNR